MLFLFLFNSFYLIDKGKICPTVLSFFVHVEISIQSWVFYLTIIRLE